MDYSAEVLRRFRAARAAGGPAQAGRVSGEAEDRSLNVWVRFDLEVVAGRIADARFQVYGCPHAIAAASRTAEWLAGRGVDALGALDVPALAERLGVPTEKVGKLLRVEDALLECRRRLDDMQAPAAAQAPAEQVKGS